MRKALTIIASIVLLLLVVRGVMDPMLCSDPWDYHIPFAAVMWDINHATNPKYDILRHFNVRFHGFGLVGEWLQGFFWWVSGSINFVPLVNSLPYVAAVVLASYWFQLPMAFVVFTTLSMPLVFIHATSGYIDLFVGSMQLLAVLAAIRLTMLYENAGNKKQKLIACLVLSLGILLSVNAKHSAFAPGLAILALTFLKIHGTTRLLVNPLKAVIAVGAIVGVCVLLQLGNVITIYAVLGYLGLHLSVVCLSLIEPGKTKRWILFWLLLLVVGSAATMIKNVYYYHNPFYPLKNPYYEFGLTFGQDENSWKYSERSHYFHYTFTKGVIDFYLSLLDVTPLRYMYTKEHQFVYTDAGQLSGYSGGLLGPLIVLLAVFLAISSLWMAYQRRLSPEVKHGIHYLLLLTLVFTVMIQSYQLRYCFVWALLLSVLCARLLRDLTVACPRRENIVVFCAAVMFVCCHLYLPLQRNFFGFKWMNYYPEGVQRQLDQKAIQDVREHGFACFNTTPAPYQYESLGECQASFLAYLPVFTGLPLHFQFVTEQDRCDKLKKPSE